MRPALYLFAKAPLPGLVKTRLACRCGEVIAAEVAETLVRETAALAAAAWPGPVELTVSPRLEHPLFGELARAHGLELGLQRGDDLGSRMAAALARGLAAGGAAAVMGCDVPQCPPAALVRASQRLARGASVLGRATDGGYYFLGLSRTVPGLFEGIDWGGPRVAEETLQRARAAGLELDTETLPRLDDVDTWDDLRAVAREVPALEHHVNGHLRAGDAR